MDGISRSPLEALADELGAVAARIEREVRLQVSAALSEIREEMAALRTARAESELRALNADRTFADLVSARLSEVRDGRDADPALIESLVERAVAAAGIDDKIADQVATAAAAIPVPRDGEPGKSADPAEIAAMVAAEVAKLPPAAPGMDADPEVVRAIVRAEVEAAVKSLPAPADGHTPTEAELAPAIETAVSRAVAALPRPKDGEDGRSVEPEEVERLVEAAVAKLPRPERGEKGEPGESVAGPRGPEGPAGKFTAIKAWGRGVHYESQIVTHAGSTYCATKDTAEEPPHEDWILVAGRGADAPVGEVRGLYDEAALYRKFDLVSFNGAEWRAKRDEPGPLPGDGWAMSAKQGKGGPPGPRGERGLSGPAGPAAPRIVDWRLDGYRAVPVMSGGETGPSLDLREVFSLYHAEAQRGA